MSSKPAPRSYMFATPQAVSELRAEKILELEFEYASKTAEQAQNDRTTVVNLYLILVGGVGSLALALPSFSGRIIGVPFGTLPLLSALLGIIGVLTFLKLIRLRQAWQDSALAMNQIKNFYLTRFPDLAGAFRWRTETLPAPGKLGTITFVLALMVALIDSVSFGAAVHLLGLRDGTPGLIIDLLTFAFALVLQALIYFYELMWSQPGAPAQSAEPGQSLPG